MPAPTNTIQTYAITGIREDLSDMIYDISPSDTPFYTKCKKGKAEATLTEWQTDSLRAAAANAHVEGDVSSADSYVTTTRYSNRTQIFKNTVIGSGTEAAVNKAGRAAEMARMVIKIAKEQKRDIEWAFFQNGAPVAGNSTTARQLAGARCWIKTNDDFGTGGAGPVTIGSTARTDGTQRAFTQTQFDTVMQEIWVAGGEPDTVYLSAAAMQTAQGFTGNNSQQSMIDAEDKTVIKHMAVYVTPWGTVEFVPSRLHRSRDVWIMQDNMWEVKTLRPTRNEPLAKDGDYEKRHIVTELTLACLNEAAHGLVADIS